MEVEAFRVRQKGKTIYLFPMKAGVLIDRCKVDRIGPDNPDGYQRPLSESRLRFVRRYLEEEEGLFPTSILLNIRDGGGVEFKSAVKVADGIERGILVIPDDKTMWLVDGQHRLEGIRYAIEKGGLEWLREYPLLVSLFVGLERYDEMREFYIVNTRQKGVPADVAERHLLEMVKVEGKMRVIELESKAKYQQARALKIVDALRQRKDSPWYRAIQFPGERKVKGAHLVRQHTMVTAVKEIFRSQVVGMVPDEELAELLINYWQAIKDLLPEAFANPAEYTVQKIPGVYAFHMVFPEVFELCREHGDFSKEKMREVLGQIKMDSEFWHVERGHHLAKETGMRSIRLLAEYLREQLPKPSLPRLRAEKPTEK